MRFWTIWTLPACSLKERLKRTRDWAAMKIGAHLPLRVRYWVTLKEIGHATRKSPNVPATTLDQILRDLDSPKSMS
jgi:hypothetical protein